VFVSKMQEIGGKVQLTWSIPFEFYSSTFGGGNSVFESSFVLNDKKFAEETTFSPRKRSTFRRATAAI
jgi:hypothetical protein